MFEPIAPSRLPPDYLAYAGGWRISGDSATARRKASLALSFQARRVFLVMGSRDGPQPVRVTLDGRPIPDSLAGEDVSDAEAVVSTQRLYRLVDLPRPGATCCPCDSRPASPATPSRSASSGLRAESTRL